jgi:hypothetical protein
VLYILKIENVNVPKNYRRQFLRFLTIYYQPRRPKMGKRRRRLNSPKFAKKYAKVRETYNRLRGAVTVAEADGVITPEEVKVIEEVKQEVVEAVAEVKAEPVAEVEHRVEQKVEPVVKKKTPRFKRARKPSKKK